MRFLNYIRTFIRLLFWNRTENRLRAGWRLLACLVLCTIGWTIGATLIEPYFSGLLGDIVQITMFVAVAVVAVGLTTYYLDRRRVRRLGFRFNREWGLDFLTGVLIGAVIPLVALAMYLGTGWASIEGVAVDMSSWSVLIVLLGGAGIMLGIGFAEELLFRGYILQNLTAGFQRLTPTSGVVIAWVGSAVLFALFHLNLGIGWYTGIHFWLAGMVFALPVLLRGELAMAIGIHAMFNYTMVYVLGLGDVGLRVSGSLLVIERGKADIWFGTAGMIETIVLLVAVIPILGWIQWRDQIPLRKQLKRHTENVTDSME